MTQREREDERPLVLVVDDEATIREVMESRLSAWGYRVELAEDGERAREFLSNHDPDLVISDVRLPDINGLDLLELLRGELGVTPCILITAYGAVDVAVEAMKRGARDFLTKPLDYERLRAILNDLEQDIEFRRATKRLDPQLSRGDGLGALIGMSPPMRELFTLIRKVAPTSTSVMITGESGTGKEVVARTLHAMGNEAAGPFVALNSAALPEGLVEAELFGHERGSFTGAVASRPGCFELAHKGTLFLDEITEMPMRLQPKLLRVLEDGRMRPIGSRTEVDVEVRIIAATNRDPREAIQERELREDLYYRLNVFHLRLPPLRERRGDVPLLANNLVAQANARHGAAVSGLNDDALEILDSYDWPGNVRELRNVIERAVILKGEGLLGPEELPASIVRREEESQPQLVLPATVTAAEAERLLILETLRQVSNNKAAAARRLGIDVKTIRNKLKSYSLDSSK